MRSLASVPIIRVERLENSGSSVGYGVKSNATLWTVSTVHRLDLSSAV